MIVIDDFIKDQQLLNDLKMTRPSLIPKVICVMVGGTRANTIKKIDTIYLGENSPYPSVNVEGFEYWIGVYSQPKKEMIYHFILIKMSIGIIKQKK